MENLAIKNDNDNDANSNSINIDILKEAKEVLATEAKALDDLRDSLSENFEEAIRIIERIKNNGGRVIVTGMGKSGHIARKIAATLSGTGTTSYFVHPAEASHGDLGMLEKNDCVIALSNSGETSELSDIIIYAKSHNLPIIGMTSNPNSTLAKQSSVALILPPHKEACGLNLSPTTSTTMMIALGDAIAVALLKLANFCAKDFGGLHPGGKLGQRLLRIESIMHTQNLPFIKSGEIMKNAIIEITKSGFGCCGIVDEQNNMIGIITDGDLRRHIDTIDLNNTRVNDIMNKTPFVVSKDELASEVLEKLNTRKINVAFVTPSSVNQKANISCQPIGIIHIHDILRAGVTN